MYDSSDPSAIPADAQMVAGYIRPSRYAWTEADFARFPLPWRNKKRITVAGWEPDAAGASIIDVEAGAFSPSQARNFVREREHMHPGTATVYLAEAALGTVLAACRGLHYWIWVAWWLGVPPDAAHLEEVNAQLAAFPGSKLAAWQYETTPGYDLSQVLAPEWHNP